MMPRNKKYGHRAKNYRTCTKNHQRRFKRKDEDRVTDLNSLCFSGAKRDIREIFRVGSGRHWLPNNSPIGLKGPAGTLTGRNFNKKTFANVSEGTPGNHGLLNGNETCSELQKRAEGAL